MRRLFALLPIVVLLAGCAQPGTGGGGTPDPATSDAFTRRAQLVAEAWRSSAAGSAWQTGFVPLQELTLPPEQGFVDDGLKQAFGAGWYRLDGSLPAVSIMEGTVRFPGGATLSVPIVPAAEAYRAIDQGDPSCPGGDPQLQPPPGSGATVSTPAPCAALTVTGATLGTVMLRTSRGVAEVPAWLFTIRGLRGPVARVAVAPSAVSPAPTPSLDTQGLEFAAAQDITAVDGAKLTYRLGVGACDEDIKPLVYQDERIVVVGGTATRPSGVCVSMLKLEPVTVTLGAPVGARPVVDVVNGVALQLTTR